MTATVLPAAISREAATSQPGPMPTTITSNCVETTQPRRALDDVRSCHAERGRRILRLDRPNRQPHVLHDLGEVDAYALDVHTEAGRGPRISGGVCCRQQRLAGHAPSPQAVTSHAITLDEQDACAERTERRPFGRSGPIGQ